MIILTILIPLLLGLLLLSMTDYKEGSPGEKLALSFMLGLGITTISMFLLSLAGIALTLLNITAAIAVLIALMSIYLFKRRIFCFSQEEFRSMKMLKLDWLEWTMTSIIGFKISAAFFFALVKPLVDVDAFQFYSLFAKGLYHGKGFFDPYLSQVLFDKPPLPYLMQGWMLISAGSLNDNLVKLGGPMLLLALALIFYASIRQEAGRKLSLLFTFFLSTLPFLFYHSTTAYADLPMTCYFSVGGIYLYRSMRATLQQRSGPALSYLLISAACLALSVWIKRGGLVLALISFVVYLSFALINKKYFNRETVRGALTALAVFAVLIVPWIAAGKAGLFVVLLQLFISNIISTPVNTFAASFEALPKPDTLMILLIFGRKLFLYADWHLTMALFTISLLFFPRRSFSRPLIYLLALIGLCILSIFLQFESKAMYRWLLDGTLFDRLVLNEIPLILFFCGTALAAALPADKPG